MYVCMSNFLVVFQFIYSLHYQSNIYINTNTKKTFTSYKNMYFQAAYSFFFYIATASGGETWCRAEAAEDLSALRGEMPAVEWKVCDDPSHPREKTNQSPEFPENEEY